MAVPIKPARLFSDAQLERFRQQGDAPADAVITSVVAEAGPAGLRSLMGWLANTTDFELSGQPDTVQRFFGEFNQLPAWADAKRRARGMAFFARHAPQIGLTLGCFSLPFCYLGADGAQVLWLTERIKDDTAKRLQETGEWFAAVNNPAEWQSGRAILRTLNVRLIHAGARWFAGHSSRWNPAWGVPVNQEDMAGTNLAFSYVVIQGLRKAGVTMTDADAEDYLHHINVTAWVNGVDEALLPQNLRQAYQLGQAIARRQFAPSEAGVGLTRSLLNAIAGQIGQSAGSGRPNTLRNLAAGEMRFFLGDQWADWLGIPATPVEKRLAGLINRLPIFSDSLFLRSA